MSDAFEFDLVFALPEAAGCEDELIDAIFEAGYDDAAVGLGAQGLLGVSMERQGSGAEAVIAAAATDILRALPEGCSLHEVRPDLVSLADVAARLGITRQALQKRRMPLPFSTGLYRAAEVGSMLASSATGKIGASLGEARGWFAASEGARRINARIALDEFRPG